MCAAILLKDVPMTKQFDSILSHWRTDLPSSLVVFLIALPLCLGIALASGAPLFSGVIAGIVGGLVVGTISKSPLSVSGPAAGLTVIVFAALQQLPTFEAFLLATCIGGLLQIALGIARAGVLGDFIPSSVITGMLAAIGLILIIKQVPHAVGYDGDFFGDEAFQQENGENTLSALAHITEHVLPGACLIGGISLLFLFWWDKKQPKMKNFLRYIPGPLVVVFFGVIANELLKTNKPEWVLPPTHLVAVPVADTVAGFLSQFRHPDFSMISNPDVWTVAITLALVASIESLLSIEAIDKLDDYKRVTPTNRELVAQGAGNIVSGLIGGLPVTSVIVRSSANASAGAHTKLSTIMHGVLLLGTVIAIPVLLNYIPLAALAAVLITVGYKLTKPAIYLAKFKKGWPYFIPFVVTVASILMTDLLVGIFVGVLVGTAFVIAQNFRSAILSVSDGNNYLIRFKKDLFFLHKYELKRVLSHLPDNSNLLLDFTRINFIDKDNIEIINDFMVNALHRKITVTIRHNEEMNTTTLFEAPRYEAA